MVHVPPITEDRFVGCLLGLAVGDALGAHFEGHAAEYIAKRYSSAIDLINDPPPGELWYTDDTQMAIGVAQTLIECRGIENRMLCKNFASNFRSQRGYGRGALLILEAMVGGHDHQYLAENLFPGGSYGNGAAMRVAPVGLLFRNDDKLLWEQARMSSLPTHIHPLGVEGAQVMALAVALASKTETLDREKFFGVLTNRCSSLEYKGPLGRAAKLDDLRNLGLFGHGIQATDSVVTAVASFGFTPDSFGETIGNVILLGGDTDTLAAMAGAISGPYLGVQAIPANLLDLPEDRTQGKSYIEQLARELYRVYSSGEDTGNVATA